MKQARSKQTERDEEKMKKCKINNADRKKQRKAKQERKINTKE